MTEDYDETGALVMRGTYLLFAKDGQAHHVKRGFVFRNRATGERYTFGFNWEAQMALSTSPQTKLVYERVRPGDAKAPCYMIRQPWELAQACAEDAMNEAALQVRAVFEKFLPSGTTWDIKVKLPLPQNHVATEIVVETSEETAKR